LEVPRKQPRSSLVALAERPCLIVVTVETTEIKLPSRIEAVAEAAAAVAGVVSRSGIDENAAFGIDMAVREAVTNAVLHGNKQDESKFVEVTLTSSAASLEIKVHDEGPGFNPELVPDPTEDENLLKTSGRGIFLMRTFMDEVEWFIRPEGGTTVRMVKNF
jgi:serine/threonine-protein kinase RsbW